MELRLACERVRESHAALHEATRRAVGELRPVGLAAELAWVDEMPPRGNGDGRSWEVRPGIHGEPNAGVSIFMTEDLGEAGERGAGGPFLTLEWLLFASLPELDGVAELRGATTAALAADAALCDAVRDAVARLPIDRIPPAFGSRGPGDISWVLQIPPEGVGDGRTWSASPNVMHTGEPGVTVSLYDDGPDNDPRTPLIAMALVPLGDLE